mmetsp:Transcript_15299/g.31088  ORF Transcript_15299/g.31088 Transcript_15299/m.31088 type:complete len:85 (+) Transcript_15299:419-673(+)
MRSERAQEEQPVTISLKELNINVDQVRNGEVDKDNGKDTGVGQGQAGLWCGVDPRPSRKIFKVRCTETRIQIEGRRHTCRRSGG